ncbi:hypothetical protein CEXT_787821 [Caerostris extrusa]|uniref:Uncharacterized protein n=1 Tax=Caerostris extrusa TaxID=172846 RepID=A0AAV4P5T6_CAEEX|nr:hypothetical protein CEXT_787821 [Caerostris extrusa]
MATYELLVLITPLLTPHSFAATFNLHLSCSCSVSESVEDTGGVVARRMNPRGGQLLRAVAQENDSLDQAENVLPPVDTMEACNKAAERSLKTLYFCTIETPRKILFQSYFRAEQSIKILPAMY